MATNPSCIHIKHLHPLLLASSQTECAITTIYTSLPDSSLCVNHIVLFSRGHLHNICSKNKTMDGVTSLQVVRLTRHEYHRCARHQNNTTNLLLKQTASLLRLIDGIPLPPQSRALQ